MGGPTTDRSGVPPQKRCFSDWWHGLLVTVLLPCPSLAQGDAASPPVRIEHPARLEISREPRVEHLSTEHGLSSNAINSMVQDHAGFLWIGTGDGLNRYDGYELTVYRNDPFAPRSLAGNRVRVVFVDHLGTLWIGTDQGLSRYHRPGDDFQRYPSVPGDPDSLSHQRVNILTEDRAGVLWIGTHRGGLNRLERSTGRFTHYRHDPENPNSLSSDEVWAVHEDRAGVLWVGTDVGGLNRFDREAGRWAHFVPVAGRPDSLSHDEVRAIHEDPDGPLWIATKGGGLNAFDRESETFRHFRHRPGDPRSLSDDSIYALAEDRAGVLWLATNDGLNSFDREREVFTALRYRRRGSVGLSDSHVRSLYEDRAGVLWVGTNRSGLDKVQPALTEFTYVDLAQTFDWGNDLIIALHPDGQGGIWIGTRSNGLLHLDRGARKLTRFRGLPVDADGVSDGQVWAIQSDGERLWVGTETLAELDRETGRYVDHIAPASGDLVDFEYGGRESFDVRALERDGPDTLWVGTDHGLVEFDRGTGRLAHHRHDPIDPTSLSHDRVTALLKDRDGELWIGTYSGLNRFDRERGTFVAYRHDPSESHSLSDNLVRALHVDSQGALWVAPHTGLDRFDKASGNFTRFATDVAPLNRQILCLVGDDRQALWLATGQGLIRFNTRDKTTRIYDVGDGLPFDRFTSCARNERGEVILGGFLQILIFQPERMARNPHVPPVALTRFKVVDRDLALNRSASRTLPHDDNFITFEFAALDFSSPAKNQYAYRLLGVDKDWIYNGHRRSASYTNLDPGEYTLRVQGSNSDGVWNRDGLSVGFRITPPVWRTWWFQALCIGAIAFAGFAVHRLRVRAIGRRKAQLEEQNTRLSEEIARRRQAELDRERFISELEEHRDQLETQNAELERFTYTVSHDLKTPLVTISGFLGLLEKDAGAGDLDRMRRDIDRIKAASGRMGQLLDELLELSRVGRVVNEPEEFCLGELAREAVQQVAGRIAEVGVEVVISPDLPRIFGDRVRLLEVLQNLIDNAVKFMGEQPEPRIEIGTGTEGGGLIFFVRDNGAGIDPRYLKKVFGLFERLDQEVEGTGVGLALVKRIIEVHGGRIWVESDGLGRGSTFYFTLPPA